MGMIICIEFLHMVHMVKHYMYLKCVNNIIKYNMGDNMRFLDKRLTEISKNKSIILYAYCFLFIICFLLIVGQNFRLDPWTDDVYHKEVVKKFGSSLNFMLDQYKNWNSRYFTSFIMAYVMDKNIWLWRILNTFVLFLFFIYMSKSVYALHKYMQSSFYVLSIITLFMFCIFCIMPSPIWHSSITWVTGSFNYLWAGCALSISLYYLFNSLFNKEKIKLYQFIMLIPAALFACNTEQTALICITMYTILILYFILKEKYFDKYILILYLFIITSTLIIFLSPALPLRYAQEVKTWYPMFNDISLVQKAVYGYAYTVIYGFLLYNYLNTILLSVLLFAVLKKQYNNKILNIISLLPALYSLMYYIGINNKWIYSHLLYNADAFSKSIILNNYSEPFISLITGTLIIVIIIYCIFKIKWQNTELKYLTFLFFAAGLMSAFILSFSPTIYASKDRIWFIPFSMYALSIGMIFMENLKYIDIYSKKYVIIYLLLCICCILSIFFKVYR